MNLVYTHLFQLMPWNPIEKAPDGYRQAVGKREEQTRSGAAKTKFATCQHFSLLGFLHLIVSSQNTAVMLKWIFMKTKLTPQGSYSIEVFVLFQRKVKIKNQMLLHIKV